MTKDLPDELFQMIEGSTDTEHCFALFLRNLPDLNAQLTLEELATTMEKTIQAIIDLCEQSAIHKASSLNFAVTDGRHVIATRFRNSGIEQPPSLYFGVGDPLTWDSDEHKPKNEQNSCCGSHASQAHGTGYDANVVIASEPTSRSSLFHWALVPKNHMVLLAQHPSCSEKIGSITIRPINVEFRDRAIDQPGKKSESISQLHLKNVIPSGRSVEVVSEGAIAKSQLKTVPNHATLRSRL